MFKSEKTAKTGDKKAAEEVEFMKRLKDMLAKGEPVRRFTVDESQSPRQETSTESIGLKAPFPGLKRPLLPDLSLNPFNDPASSQRGFGDFLRALNEVDRVSRRPKLDVFE